MTKEVRIHLVQLGFPNMVIDVLLAISVPNVFNNACGAEIARWMPFISVEGINYFE